MSETHCHEGHGRNDATDAAHAEYRRAFLRMSVDNEVDRLALKHGDENAPIGGWRNRGHLVIRATLTATVLAVAVFNVQDY